MKLKLFLLFCVAGFISNFFFSCKKEFSSIGNKPPVANAGRDTTISLPSNKVLLDGNASYDPDGAISSYKWSKISGPASFNIENRGAASTIVKDLIEGTYFFELIVTDAGKLSALDIVRVIVTASNNLAPVAIAGNDTLLQSTQPACTPVQLTITLNGSNSYDPDGNIVSYHWSGPGTIADPNSAITTVTGLFQGAIGYSLQVTDNEGAVDAGYVQFSIVTGNRPMVNVTMTAFGNLSIPRGGMAVASAGNKILFAGGMTDVGASAWTGESRVDIYNITTDSWSTTELSVARHGIAAVAAGNKIFFAGGHTSVYGDVDIGEYSTVDIYDVSTNTWSVAQLSEPRGYLSAVALGNKVFFAGGYWIEGPWTFHYSRKVDIYDLSTDTWSTAMLSEPRAGISAIASNNKVYFAGGESALLNSVYSNKIDIYDNNTNTWSVSTLTRPKVVSGIFANNKLYWAGGYDSQNTICEVEIRDAVTQSTSLDYLSHPHAVENAVLKDNKILFTNLQEPFDLFNLNTNTWYIGILPKKNSGAAVISVNNTIYIAGGWAYESHNYTNQVWKLDF